MRWIVRHARLHARFYVPALIGVLVWAATVGQDQALRLLVAGDSFFATHILAMGWLARGASHAAFRRRAANGDEGLVVIGLIALLAVTLSLGSIFTLVSQDDERGFTLALAIASVPLGWFMLHTVWAFHYAHAYYAERKGGGLKFPGGGEPQAWDFFYYAFVVGMTAQVSDVTATNGKMRNLTLAHSVLSFFYNTVILAIAVNVAVMLAGQAKPGA